MASLESDHFSDLDKKQFEQLIRSESVSWEGQALLMAQIPDMVRERIEQRRINSKREMMQRGFSDHNASHRATALASDIQFHQVSLPNGRSQCIIGRGDHARSFKAKNRRPSNRALNVFVPAHIDTVAASTELFDIKIDPNNADKWEGRGVYDMKVQALNGLALAADLTIPHGMNVFFGNIYDEERNSKGAQALLQNWEWWDYMDIVLGSEIGHIKQEPGDNRIPIIHGRRGRHKYHAVLEVTDNGLGHFADKHVRSARQAMGEAIHMLVDRFYHSKGAGKKILMRSHPNFDDEKLEIGAGEEDQSYSALKSELNRLIRQPAEMTHALLAALLKKVEHMDEQREQRSTSTTREGFYYSIQSVPGRRMEESLAEQRALFKEIATQCNWDGHSITWKVTVNEDETSYDGFSMPEESAISRLLLNTVPRAYSAYAPSVADENIYAASFYARASKGKLPPYQGVFSIPPKGDNAHRSDEWVSVKSALEVRQAHKTLIENPSGLQQLIKLKKAYRA